MEGLQPGKPLRRFPPSAIFSRATCRREIKVPIGIIAEAYGASTAESWIRRETMAADPETQADAGPL